MRRLFETGCVVVAVVACGSDPHVTRPYGGWSEFERGSLYADFHSGVDFGGKEGEPVLAADDGVIAAQMYAPHGVGRCVLVEHHCYSCTPRIFFTSYCHVRRSLVVSGQTVVRGQQIAEVGQSGPFAGGNPHVHFSMCSYPCAAGAYEQGTFDPMRYDVGCFDPMRSYTETAIPILTHPIVCTGK